MDRGLDLVPVGVNSPYITLFTLNLVNLHESALHGRSPFTGDALGMVSRYHSHRRITLEFDFVLPPKCAQHGTRNN